MDHELIRGITRLKQSGWENDKLWLKVPAGHSNRGFGLLGKIPHKLSFRRTEEVSCSRRMRSITAEIKENTLKKKKKMILLKKSLVSTVKGKKKMNYQLMLDI